MTTIDSFMTRTLRAFAAEAGLPGAFRIVEEDAAKALRAAVVEKTMGDAGGEAYERYSVIVQSISGGRFPRSLSEDIAEKISSWHEELLDRLAAGTGLSPWGDPAEIWGRSRPALAKALALPEEALRGRLAARLAAFREAARPVFDEAGLGDKFDGACADIARAGLGVLASSRVTPAKKLAEAAFADGAGESAVVKFGAKKGEKIELAGAAAAALAALGEAMLAVALKIACEKARGLYGLSLAFENDYRERVRSRGRLVFGDQPRLLRFLPKEAATALAWRLDARIAHMALDEFQDTSPGQWAVLRPIADEIKQSDDGRRTLFVVGDAKQAIYGWRGGDSRLFAEEEADSAYCLRSLVESYRFSPEIAAFVNRVFAPAEIRKSMDAAQNAPGRAASLAVEAWEKIWEEQSSKAPPAGDAAVRVLNLENAVARTAAPGGFLEAAAAAIAADLAAHPVDGRGKDGVAVLVPENKEGKRICEALLREGVSAVWEGQSAISDHPICSAILSLLLLAEHPDTASAAWGRVKTSPFRTLGGGADADESERGAIRRVSSTVARTVARFGLAAALRQWCGDALEACEKSEIDSALREKLDALVAAAADFVHDETRDGTLTGFVEFARSREERAFADPTVVKIVTQHRSKGLTFDRVYLPMPETRTGFGTPAVHPDKIADPARPSRWIIPAAPQIDRDETIRDAIDEAKAAKTLETLCAWYVAFTRARTSLAVLLPTAEAAPKTMRFLNHVARVALETARGVEE
ncbi:MAG: UvrD-helicase domain-containing protein, partial [Kiritimatiellae bacterium]|nr:UvrD-helicase domain-containing protein [Kiritimatiellia bacterium]